ncbi:MAG: hypothetical protein R2880_07535 [Deinococcales bacterium]
MATMLVQEGTLNVGDYIVTGEAWAKIRALIDENGKRLKEAGPSTPVQILGFTDQPVAGDQVEQVKNERIAKALAQSRIEEREERRERDEANNKKSPHPLRSLCS